MRVAGARILVVGGSAGIGLELGRRALAEGARVAFAARRADVLDDIARAHNDAIGVQLDVRDEASITRALADTAARFEGLDAVVCTAGVARLAHLSEQGADEWREVLETNVMGPALVARAAIPHLTPGSGVMLFCSSNVEDQPRWGLGPYGVSKVALNRLVESLRAEYEDIRFVRATIGPTVGTEFGANFSGDALNEAFARWIVHAQHTTQMMDVGEVAGVLLEFIATLLAHPTVHFPAVYVEPPGGALTLPPTPDVIARAFAPPSAGDDS